MMVEMVNQYGVNALRVTVAQGDALLDTNQVDALIEQLSLIRAGMRPEISPKPVPAHQYPIEVDPCWYSEKHPLFEGAVLFLRHTGLGWAGFAIPKESLVRLNEALSAHADASFDTNGVPN
jgi:hypothetical protein